MAARPRPPNVKPPGRGRGPRSRPRVSRRSRRGRSARNRADRERTWPTRIGTVWGAALVLNFIWPVSYTPANRFFGSDGGWTFIWDHWKGSDVVEVLFTVLPVLFGVAAIYAARRLPAPKQAFVYMAGGLVCLLGPVFIKTGRGMMFSPAGGEFGAVLALTIVLGPVLLGAGHHVARRRPTWRPGVVLTALGGVLLVASFFIPLVRGSESLVGVLLDSRFMSRGWPLTLWGLGMMVTGITAACLLLPDFKPARTSPFLGTMIRVLLIGLPAAFMVVILSAGSGEAFLSFIASIGWFVTRIYALLILSAAGLALVFRGPQAVDLAEAVEVF